MRIEKQLKNYIVFSGDALINALCKINENQSRIVFVVDYSGVLIGALSDGDVRRWLTKNKEFDLDVEVDKVMNRDFVAHPITDSNESINQHFDNKRDIIPLYDEWGRFVALTRRSAAGFEFGRFIIDDDQPTFVIAEVGNNHQGDLAFAKELVDRAVESHADCVKFQMRDLKSLYTNHGNNAEVKYDLGSQYTLELLNKYQLSDDELCQVFDYARQRGIMPLCTPWDLTSVKVLDEYGLEGFKVASADFTNFEMLRAIAETNKPIICSTGMSTEAEIKGTVAELKRLGVSFSLLHCNSTYPAPYKDVNLCYLLRLKKMAGSVVGYSGHERGYDVPIAAVAMGARIIEKHFTTDRSLEGNDHKVSLLPNEFAEMVRSIRNVEEAMGSGGERNLTQGELINRENLAKSVVVKQDVAKAQTIQRYMLEVKSPGQGLQPNRIDELVGKQALRELHAGDVLFESDLKPQSPKKQHYQFNRPYGIPVRYHDYQTLIDGMQIDFIEFHLSYHDLEVDLSRYFDGPLPIGYAVHTPELFAGDHIIDLANDNESYIENSIEELKRTVNVAIDLQKYFPSTEKPVLVLNAGGWSSKGFLAVEKRSELYDLVVDSLARVDLSSVRLAIQTMPPFPWHFGGQSHHNLFVDAEEIVEFCSRTGYRICLDVSHSMMACNYYRWDFCKFLKTVLPLTIHLHIADAKGVDGEGVQIGEGDVDFNILRDLINEYASGVQFIPEVWQGHKNKGEGFWKALEFLEKKAF